MNILPIQPRHNIIPLDGWQLYRRDGEQFLRTAVSAHRRGNPRFTPEIVYNLVAMAIEKLIMALLMRRGDLADNHTMVDLLAALRAPSRAVAGPDRGFHLPRRFSADLRPGDLPSPAPRTGRYRADRGHRSQDEGTARPLPLSGPTGTAARGKLIRPPGSPAAYSRWMI